MKRLVSSSFVIARRDFTATVLSKAFIFFLIGPLLPLVFGGIFAGIGATAAERDNKPVIGVIASEQAYQPLAEARTRLTQSLGEGGIPQLVRFQPDGPLPAQQKRLLASHEQPILAVLSLHGSYAILTGAVTQGGENSRRLQLLLDEVRSPSTGPLPQIEVVTTGQSSGKLASGRSATAHAGQFLIFFLTILLAGMLLSQVIEEKSNKIIEVIAAAIPIDAMFLGKLFAMLGASLVGIFVWASVGAVIVSVGREGGLSDLPAPAVGWPAFICFGIVYFTTYYLLLGALFLGIGAQANTPREVQTISMPVTILQVIIFAVATAIIGNYDGGLGIAAAVFPLSSPMVMLARAAELPELWPHVAALAWQALWVALILRWGARFFRSRVLKSGPGQSLFRRSARTN